jgi:hypothetical protein
MRVLLVLGLGLSVAGCGSNEYKWEMYHLSPRGYALRLNKETGQTWMCDTSGVCRQVKEYDREGSGLPISRPKKEAVK